MITWSLEGSGVRTGSLKFVDLKFVEKVLKVFVLRKEKHIRSLHNLSPQKMEIIEVFHGKLSGKKIYNVVQKRGRGAHEDNVIDIQEQDKKSCGMT